MRQPSGAHQGSGHGWRKLTLGRFSVCCLQTTMGAKTLKQKTIDQTRLMSLMWNNGQVRRAHKELCCKINRRYGARRRRRDVWFGVFLYCLALILSIKVHYAVIFHLLLFWTFNFPLWIWRKSNSRGLALNLLCNSNFKDLWKAILKHL